MDACMHQSRGEHFHDSVVGRERCGVPLQRCALLAVTLLLNAVPGLPLGTDYVRCANRAQMRNGERRDSSLANLVMPDGREVRFDRKARAGIPEAVIEEIRRVWTVHKCGHLGAAAEALGCHGDAVRTELQMIHTLGCVMIHTLGCVV